MSTISPKKLEKLLDEVPGLDSETRKKLRRLTSLLNQSDGGGDMEPPPLKQSKLILSKD